jgi:hypothetical protein
MASAFEGEVTEAGEIYADYGATRELVEIDTNYKATRPGEHSVRWPAPTP